jgi:hypothetical protein
LRQRRSARGFLLKDAGPELLVQAVRVASSALLTVTLMIKIIE